MDKYYKKEALKEAIPPLQVLGRLDHMETLNPTIDIKVSLFSDDYSEGLTVPQLIDLTTQWDNLFSVDVTVKYGGLETNFTVPVLLFPGFENNLKLKNGEYWDLLILNHCVDMISADQMLTVGQNYAQMCERYFSNSNSN